MEYKTQMEAAKKRILTEQVRKVAQREGTKTHVPCVEKCAL